MFYSPEERRRRQRLRNMYSKYKDHLEGSDNVVFRNTNPGFYSIGKGGEHVPPSKNLKATSFPNRFKKFHGVRRCRNAVRDEMRKLLREESKQSPFKSAFTFMATTAVAFIALLLVFNASSYLSVATHWYNVLTSQGETYKSFALFENNTARTPLPTTHAAADTSGTTLPELTNLNFEVVPPDNRIIIPSIGKNIPIQDISSDNLIQENWQALEEDLQKGLQKGVVRYPGTAIPGQIGNVFITGHSSYYLWDPGKYKDVFALLHNVEIGDQITVFYEQKKFTYTVTEKKVVSPNDVDVLKQTDDKRLTLMTCTPIGTALNRLIIVAEQNT